MKFDHLVEINDPLNPLIEPMTRSQLWHGLVLRATSPKLFVPWLDRCDILARNAGGLERMLYYGELAIRDTVTFSPQTLVQYDVPKQEDIAASRLLVAIEEPTRDLLYVRFSYDDGAPEEAGSMDAFYNEYKRSAYQESDIDTIRIIRQLGNEGRFDAPLS